MIIVMISIIILSNDFIKGGGPQFDCISFLFINSELSTSWTDGDNFLHHHIILFHFNSHSRLTGPKWDSRPRGIRGLRRAWVLGVHFRDASAHQTWLCKRTSYSVTLEENPTSLKKAQLYELNELKWTWHQRQLQEQAWFYSVEVWHCLPVTSGTP